MDGLKILYIEDDAHTATRVKELALSRGDDLHWESDGAAGLRIAGRDRFDVIILDRMLGDDDGLKILARLRESGDSNAATGFTGSMRNASSAPPSAARRGKRTPATSASLTAPASSRRKRMCSP